MFRLATVVVLLIVLAGGAVAVFSFFGEVIYRDEIAQLQKKSECAQVEISARTKLNATVSIGWTTSFTSGLTVSNAQVFFQFVPPTADWPALRETAKKAVQQCAPEIGMVDVRGETPYIPRSPTP